MEVTQTIDLVELVEKLHTVECVANVSLAFVLACIFGLLAVILVGLNHGTKKDTHN